MPNTRAPLAADMSSESLLVGETCVPPVHHLLWHALESHSGPWLTFHLPAELKPVSASQVRALALSWAGAIRAGVRGAPVERVGLLLPNCPEFVAAFFAAHALGAVPVPLPWPVIGGNAAAVQQALSPVVRQARLSVLVTSPEFASADWGAPTVTAPGEPIAAPFGAQAAQAAFIQFTSGSTGDPRGVVISQRAALWSARAMGQALNLGADDVGVSWLPFFHDMGLVGVLLVSLVHGFRVHILRPGDFLMQPRRWLELISSTLATLTVGPNFAWEMVARRVAPQGLELSSLRAALNGSEPVHRSTLRAVAERFASAGLRAEALLPVYGLAEATLGVTFSRPDETLSDVVVGERSVPSVGRPLPGVRVAVVSPDGHPVAPGTEGEICVHGDVVMRGYFDRPEATAAVLRDGWLHTGDLGVVTDGQLFVTGREKEIIIQHGRKFSPYDIERLVGSLVDSTPNGIAAISRVHGVAGDHLVVVIELRRQSQVVDGPFLRGQVLAQLGARVDAIELVPAGTLPRTTSGKIRRRAVALGVTPAGARSC